jgi:hypothetical protein
MQLAELREIAGRRGWQIVEEFTDQGVSGCKESRPALNRLMSDACRRRFDAILVWKIDRFGTLSKAFGQCASRTRGPETTGAVPQHERASSDGNRPRNRLPQENTNRKKLPPEVNHVFEPSFSTPTRFFAN